MKIQQIINMSSSNQIELIWASRPPLGPILEATADRNVNKQNNFWFL